MAEYDTPKEKFLYVVGLKHPLAFLNGRRKLKSVMSRHVAMWETFRQRYGDSCSMVCDYYDLMKERVHVVDMKSCLPQLAGVALADGPD